MERNDKLFLILVAINDRIKTMKDFFVKFFAMLKERAFSTILIIVAIILIIMGI